MASNNTTQTTYNEILNNMTCDSVKNLTKILRNFKGVGEDDAGIYRWWFEEDDAKKLLNNLTVSWNIIQTKTIGNKTYYCLYFGIAAHLHERLKWHISQKHSNSAVKSGYLSTLRQTISALLNMDMSKSQKDVNKIIDNCYIEYSYTQSKNEAEKIEKAQLTQYYYPLNLQGNKCVDKSIIKQIKKKRKGHKK